MKRKTKTITTRRALTLSAAFLFLIIQGSGASGIAAELSGGAMQRGEAGNGGRSGAGGGVIAGEQVDPFYIKLFEEGKSLWFRGLTAKAIENMEIAYFGFLKSPDLLLEAGIYLMIAHFEAKNADRAAFFEAKVAELAERERVARLRLPPQVVDKYQEASAYFGRLRAAGRMTASRTGQAVSPLIKGETPGAPAVPANPYSEIAGLERQIKNDRMNFAAHLRLAFLYMETNNPKKARSVLQRLLALDPGNSAARFELAKAHMALRKFKDALAELDKAAAALDGDIEFHYQRAIAEYEVKNYLEARKEFERVNSLSPGYKLTAKYLEEIIRLNPGQE